MSRVPYIRFYSDDWLSGTSELSLEERGALVTLVALTASTGDAPEYNLDRLSRRFGCTKNKTKKVISELVNLGKIWIDEDKIFNNRALKETKKSQNFSKKQLESAKNKWEKNEEKNEEKIGKSNKNNGTVDATAYDSGMPKGIPEGMPNRCQPEPEPEEKRNTNVFPKKARQFPVDWMPSELAIEYCISKQFDQTQIGQMVEDCTNHHRSKGSTFKDLDAAFRTWASNQIKFHGHPDAQRRKASGKSDTNPSNSGMAGDATLDAIAIAARAF